jgi:hypothetical protein
MASHSFKFDPNAGTSQGVNLVINTGANFKDSFTITNPSGTAFDFSSWSGSAQMAKSVAVGATIGAEATFTVGFTSAAGGKFDLTLQPAITRNLSEGRYVHNILVSSGSTVYTIASGNVLVNAGIASAP